MTRIVLTKLAVTVAVLSLSLTAVAAEESAAGVDALAQAGDAEVASAGDAVAEDVEDVGEEVDASVSSSAEEEDDKGWSVGANTGLSLGIGAFASNEYVRRNRLRYNMGFNGSYTIPVVDVSVSLNTGFSQWLSESGGSQNVQEFRWSDTSLGLGYMIGKIPVVDIMVNASLGASLPTSTMSRAMGHYTSLSPGLSFSSKAGPVGFSYSVGYSHNFYEYTSVTFSPDEVDILSRTGGSEVLASDAIAMGGVLPEMGLNNNFGVSYSIIDELKFSVGFGFSDSWSFDNGTITADDAFTADLADAGRGHSQMTNGSLKLTYSPIANISTSLSMSSSQPWMTADNKGYRFPFFDFEATSRNYTNIRFGVSGHY